MNKIITTALAATLLASTATMAFAQVSVDAGAGAKAGVSVEAPAVDAAVGADANAAVNAAAGSENSFAGATAAVAAGATADLSAVTEASNIGIVLVSSLQGDAATEGKALDEAISANADAQAALQAQVDGNAAIKAKLDAGGYTADDVVAVASNVDGSVIVYVDDRA